jgi:ketopantoate reductase
MEQNLVHRANLKAITNPFDCGNQCDLALIAVKSPQTLQAAEKAKIILKGE